MATYPGAVKSFTDPAAADKLNSPSHAQQHIDENAEINAIETELGVTPKGTHATVRARLDAIDTALATCDINAGTIDGVTIGATAAPTVTNLGSVTTCDINGGTIDGVQIGAETLTGMILVNNASDQADGLGSQGTSGQVLTSQGSGANPTWTTPATAVSTKCGVGAATNAASSLTFTAGTWQDIANISVSITTTATSTFYASAYGSISLPSAWSTWQARIVRDSTEVAVNSATITPSSTGFSFAVAGSEASVAAGTYTMKVQIKSVASSGSLSVGTTAMLQVTAVN
jgi:hypothetical protein